MMLAESEVEPDGKHDITELHPPHVVTGAAACGSSRVLSSPPILGLGLLQVMHIQEGVEEQGVLFHNFMHKTLQELQATLAAK